MGSKEWFDLDLIHAICDLKINRDYLLIENSPCTKFGIDQVKGSKDIILSGQHLVYRPTDRPTYRPTDRQLRNNMPPFSRGGGGIKIYPVVLKKKKFIFTTTGGSTEQRGAKGTPPPPKKRERVPKTRKYYCISVNELATYLNGTLLLFKTFATVSF